MALRFRAGIPVTRSGHTCMHEKCKDDKDICGKSLDVYGDHCVLCGIGGHLFTRHGALNHILAEAGRSAGYAVLEEQVIPELAQVKIASDGAVSIKEARVDVELYGHAFAPDHLLDGTIRHPASTGSLSGTVREVGFAAEEGAKSKLK